MLTKSERDTTILDLWVSIFRIIPNNLRNTKYCNQCGESQIGMISQQQQRQQQRDQCPSPRSCRCYRKLNQTGLFTLSRRKGKASLAAYGYFYNVRLRPNKCTWHGPTLDDIQYISV